MTSRPPALSRKERLGLWFGFLGGALAWLSHLIAISLIAEWGCFGGLYRTTWYGLTLVAWLVIAVSIVLALVAAAATWAAWRVGRRTGDSEPGDPHSEAPDSFLARAGVLTSGVFVLIIVVESVPILFFLQRC